MVTMDTAHSENEESESFMNCRLHIGPASFPLNRPHRPRNFDYIIRITESSLRKKISKLQPLQNRAVKMILRRYEYICSADMLLLHEQSGLQMLDMRRKIFMLCFMFKYSKKIEHLDLYRPDMVSRGRNKVKMKLQYSNKGKYLW